MFMLGAASQPQYRDKHSRGKPPGLRRTDQKSLLLGLVPAESAGGRHTCPLPADP